MEHNDANKTDNNANNSNDINNNDQPVISKKEQIKNKRAAKLAFRNQFGSEEEYEAAMKAKNPNYRPSKRRKIVQEKQQENKKTNKIQDQLEDFDNDHVEYEIKNGLRYVVPYQYTFTSFAKKRWLNRSLVEVLLEEFKKYDRDHYLRAIDEGLLTTNGNKIDKNAVVQEHDVIRHTVLRTEPPVTAQEIKIVHEDDEILVVDKPASIPVHPCGRFRHNSILCILAKELNKKKLYAIHRLDRLTSGILFFAKTKTKAEELVNRIKGSKVQKQYLAKVYGIFLEGEIKVDQPIYKRDSHQGLHIVDPRGKSATTLFSKVSSDGTTSIVKCTPITGRTHQIRVHLQWLGHSIINDPIYNTNRSNYDESFKLEYDDEGDVIENSDTLNMNDVQLHICLHALSYKSLDPEQQWEFHTELPFWAKTIL